MMLHTVINSHSSLNKNINNNKNGGASGDLSSNLLEGEQQEEGGQARRQPMTLIPTTTTTTTPRPTPTTASRHYHRNNNNNMYPTVYQETRDMLLSAILIYGVMDLRALAKKGGWVSMMDEDFDDDDDNANDKDPPARDRGGRPSSPPPPPSSSSSSAAAFSTGGCYLAQRLLQLPISARDVVWLVQKHRLQIERHVGHESTELYLGAFDSLSSLSDSLGGAFRAQESRSTPDMEVEKEEEGRNGSARYLADGFSVRVVGGDDDSDSNFDSGIHDSNSEHHNRGSCTNSNSKKHHDTDLVYAICADSTRKRLTVIFRGCSTRHDWQVCANNLLQTRPNPFYTQTETNGEDTCDENEDGKNMDTEEDMDGGGHHTTDQGDMEMTTASQSRPSHSSPPLSRGSQHCRSSTSPSSSSSTRKKQPRTVAIHSGCYDYLFKSKSKIKKKNMKATKNGGHPQNGSSKFDEIVAHLQDLQEEFPGYAIYTTGHSLGAALATVFSFQWAALGVSSIDEKKDGDDDDPSTAAIQPPSPPSIVPPITCINFASPMVGNLAFETVFRDLESQGRIRCLRVTNHFDIFTQLPDRGNWLYLVACVPVAGFHLVAYVGLSLFFFLFFQHNVYRHVGMDLHIYKQQQRWWRRFFCCDCWSKCYSYCCCCCWRRNDDDNRPQYTYKVKHSKGTPDNYAWRVALDWKKHYKQAVQRCMMIPFVFDFNTNHSVQEHLERLTGLEHELDGVYLEDLYRGHMMSTSPRGDDNSSSWCGVMV